MKVDTKNSKGKRICIELNAELYTMLNIYLAEKQSVLKYIKALIQQDLISNSEDARLHVYRCIVKPAIYSVFTGSQDMEHQVDIEDIL